MSVFTEIENTWTTTYENKLDRGVAQRSRRSSASSASSSGSSETSELSDLSDQYEASELSAASELSEATTNTTISITSLNNYGGDDEAESYLVQDEKSLWRPLKTEDAVFQAEELSLSTSPCLSSTSLELLAAQYPSQSKRESFCQGSPRQGLSHHQSATEYVATPDLDFTHTHDVSSLSQSCIDDTKPVLPANPRRTSASKTWSRPTLVRQVARRQDFVMHLVGKSTYHSSLPDTFVHTFSPLSESATQLVSHIWPEAKSSSTACEQHHQQQQQIISLRYFIRETLRRSHSTHSTLQLTLYYIHLLKMKGNIPSCGVWPARPVDASYRSMQCGRRMFLSALILASKYLQDRNYSAKAWSKITSLPVKEINANERTFLKAVNYDLHLDVEKYNEWCANVSECVDAVSAGKTCPWGMVLEACKGISNSMMSTASSIMSALQGAPAVGASKIISEMPDLCTLPRIMAPIRASSARVATCPSKSTIFQGLGIFSNTCNANNNNKIMTPPSSFTSSDESPFVCSGQSSFHRPSPPAFLQATHLPTPPSSVPSILSSAQDEPLDLPLCAQAQDSETKHQGESIESMLATRLVALSQQAGISPPWSVTSGQDDLPPMQFRAAEEHNVKLPAIADLLCGGLKNGLQQGIKKGLEYGFEQCLQPVQPLITLESLESPWVDTDWTTRICGVKRSCCDRDNYAAESCKKSRTW